MPYGMIVEPAGFTGAARERPQVMDDLGIKVVTWIGARCEKKFTPFAPGVT